MASEAVRMAHQSRTTLVAFSATTPFSLRLPNASAAAEQKGEAGRTYLTNVGALVNQVLVHNQSQFRIESAPVRIDCLARDSWRSHDFRGQRVAVLLSSHALGENVQIVLFLQAFLEHHRPQELVAFCTGPAHDIYLTNPAIRALPLWIDREELTGYDAVIDLGHLEGVSNIDLWPVDYEANLLADFDLAPSGRYPSESRTYAPHGRAKIGVFPLASSPLRTLPVPATVAVIRALSVEGDVTLCLNRNQRQGVLYAAAIAAEALPEVTVMDGFESIAALIQAIDGFDYGVFADSGPAHLAKLVAVPGVAVYTSAPGDVLQGRFRNLARWAVPFVGPRCRAPCGLAKVRAAPDGRIGCMGSLQTTLAGLPGVPRTADPETVERLMREPVPCVAQLALDPAPLAAFIVADLAARRR
ncbi:MAG: hypothetical protein EXQ91_03615 [Alphaproteobacteria bacterium]|nr:hypothetical protein [Alphaproteobacteria bacterium]